MFRVTLPQTANTISNDHKISDYKNTAIKVKTSKQTKTLHTVTV